ncbi:MAG TPA: hypothetical protein VMP00_04350, partial [Burkholderiales bacterium]|nr:hypothetical protein [Burkholderiales bacterium]
VLLPLAAGSPAPVYGRVEIEWLFCCHGRRNLTIVVSHEGQVQMQLTTKVTKGTKRNEIQGRSWCSWCSWWFVLALIFARPI